MRSFDELLIDATTMHRGCICPGQVLGVRMAMLGWQFLGIDGPTEGKQLIVYIEIDRCMADAIAAVTGCRLGKRTMKFLDYGKMAATFLNLKTGKAVRIVAREEAKQKAKDYFPEIGKKYLAQTEAYKIMPDHELFEIREVNIKLKPEDMPGRPTRRVQCDQCGEYVQDMREIYQGNKVLCKPCAEGGYYTLQISSPLNHFTLISTLSLNPKIPI